MNERFTLAIFLSFICLALHNHAYTQSDNSNRKGGAPNIVVLIADDVSWNDLGCYGSTFAETPNIDKLAAGGMKFNNAILTASSCSPSRISIMTGRYPHNTGAAELHTEPKTDFESMASRLKDNDSTRLDLSKYFIEIKCFDFHVGGGGKGTQRARCI